MLLLYIFCVSASPRSLRPPSYISSLYPEPVIWPSEELLWSCALYNDMNRKWWVISMVSVLCIVLIIDQAYLFVMTRKILEKKLFSEICGVYEVLLKVCLWLLTQNSGVHDEKVGDLWLVEDQTCSEEANSFKCWSFAFSWFGFWRCCLGLD